ncbi:hypothetical protein [Dongia sedimenti]|uniref:Uncharacterized protein n=1 Tax=Dongia sedimenti TaxID=3064282 RepID=A0ABU0YT51_9PROT|nr:hypothetical protein [Rhodospirillaceae bacterium R-7]
MRIVLIASVLVLSGCSTVEGWFGDGKPSPKSQDSAAAAPSGDKVTITKATWAAFENYKYWLTPIAWNRPMGQGYFAVAEDGRSWGLTGCPVNECVTGSPVSQDAINICQTRSGGVPCSVFAKDQDIIVPYEISE